MKKILASNLNVGDRFVYATDIDPEDESFDPVAVKTVIGFGSAIAFWYPCGTVVVHTFKYLDNDHGIFLLGDEELPQP